MKFDVLPPREQIVTTVKRIYSLSRQDLTLSNRLRHL